jgi:hypothetical protein
MTLGEPMKRYINVRPMIFHPLENLDDGKKITKQDLLWQLNSGILELQGDKVQMVKKDFRDPLVFREKAIQVIGERIKAINKLIKSNKWTPGSVEELYNLIDGMG